MDKVKLTLVLVLMVLTFEVRPIEAFFDGKSLGDAIVDGVKQLFISLWNTLKSVLDSLAREFKKLFHKYMNQLHKKGDDFKDKANKELKGILDGNLLGIMNLYLSYEDEELHLSKFQREIILEEEFDKIDGIVHNFEIIKWISVALIFLQIVAICIILLGHYISKLKYQDFKDRMERLKKLHEHFK